MYIYYGECLSEKEWIEQEEIEYVFRLATIRAKRPEALPGN